MNILVIGDVCTDSFQYGKITRINPEAPTPIFVPNRRREVNIGMAGNVISNLESLKNSGDAVYSITNDYADITKDRLVDETSNYIILRVDTEKVTSHFNLEEFRKTIKKYGIDCIVISDYNKGFLTRSDISDISIYARQESIPVFLDTKKILGEWSSKIDFVKINKSEYDKNLQETDCPIDLWCKNLIVTLGADGCSLQAPWREIKTFSQEPVKVRDVVGAGDTFLAAFAIKYMESGSITEACVFANKAAGVAVSKPGVVCVKREEIK